MKTKPFLLATAGSTVDGRTIDDKMLKDMASSYDPKTYGARLNIEHIRGISADKPFRAYGDVLELSTGDVVVNFNGKPETRLGLYGTFDVTDDAKQLNDAGQKVYPSIEILPDFGGKGFAYLAGCALTDSPASIGTDRLVFNRTLPGTLTLTAEPQGLAPALLVPADEVAAADPTGIFASIKTLIDKFTGPPQPQSEQPVVPAAPAAEPVNAGADLVALAAAVGQLSTSMQTFMTKSDAAQTKLAGDFAALQADVENTPAGSFTARPRSDGGEGRAKTDC